MAITGTANVRCPACGTTQDVQLVQSLNARDDGALVDRLVAGDLNVLACTCGKRTLLEATLLFHDPASDYFCQACPGGEDAMTRGARAFAAIAHATATRRLVPSHNALVEKVLILRAGLDDGALEVLKVILLASRGDDLDRILLFDRIDRDAQHIHWRLPDQQRSIASPLDGYTRLAATLTTRPGPDELRIDRAWAITTARAMVESAS
jgi:hypothetical protein